MKTTIEKISARIASTLAFCNVKFEQSATVDMVMGQVVETTFEGKSIVVGISTDDGKIHALVTDAEGNFKDHVASICAYSPRASIIRFASEVMA